MRVTGLVQGVSYRATAQDVARSLGVAGWVRNLPNGDVELTAQARAEPLERFLAWCRNGPDEARVELIDVRDESPDAGMVGFEVRR